MLFSDGVIKFELLPDYLDGVVMSVAIRRVVILTSGEVKKLEMLPGGGAHL